MEFTLNVSSLALEFTLGCAYLLFCRGSGDFRISNLCYINSTKDYVRIYKQIMQNKPNFRSAQMNINTIVTMRYVNLGTWRGTKTKPIQSQNKPNLSQFKANLTQNKPNQTQLFQRVSIAFESLNFWEILSIICKKLMTMKEK